MKIIVKTLFGLEDILIDELQGLGVKNIKKLNRAVSFEGSLEDVYRCNLHLRTGLRVLISLKEEKLNKADDLYKLARSIEWEEIFSLQKTFSVDVVAYSDLFNHSNFIGLKVKDAIVDTFRANQGKRPNVNPAKPDIRISVHLSGNNCSISLDSSGISLHKRGYRSPGAAAPMNEVLSAGIILMSGWDRKRTFIDPMCGSGTAVAEAAMIAYNIPPAMHRGYFPFQHWKNYDHKLWESIKQKAEEQIKTTGPIIIGSDRAALEIRQARENLKQRELDDKVRFFALPFERFESEHKEGIVFLNPPYGERLQPEKIDQLYEKIGDTLKNRFKGFEVWLISSNLDALKSVGLRPDKKMRIFNGKLECKLHKYTIFEGVMKDFKAKQNKNQKWKKNHKK